MRRRRKGGGLDFNFSSLDFTTPGEEHKPVPRLNLEPVIFDNAEAMARDIDWSRDYIAITAGSFIFGDFIEALCYVKRLDPSAVYLSTLGMSQDNADSIVNLTDYLGAEQVYLLVSHYFQGVERHRTMPYLEESFTGRPINVAVLQNHAKICLIRSATGDACMIGSANLSSSNSVECFVITHAPEVVEWVQARLDNIFDRFTVFHGLDGTANRKRMKNTGRDAYLAMIKERVTNGTDNRRERVEREREDRQRAGPAEPIRPGGTSDH